MRLGQGLGLFLVVALSGACATRHAVEAPPTAPASSEAPPTRQTPVSSAPSATQATQAPQSLAQRVAASVLRLRPGTRIEERGPLELWVWAPNEQQVYLENLTQSCDASPEKCGEFIDRFSRNIVSPPTAALTASAIMPALKDRAYIAHVEQLFAAMTPPQKLLKFPFVDELSLILVQDTPEAVKVLSEHDIQAIRLSPAQARDAALANLRREAPSFEVAELEPGLFELQHGNSYDAAMLALVPEWKSVAAKVRGDLVVAPLGRDTVFFTGTQSGAAFAHLQAIIEHEQQSPRVPYPISTTLYRWRPTGWQRFDLMPGVKR